MDARQRFGEVVLPYLDDALSLARWLTGSVADAEDVVQEACVRAFGAVGTARDNPRAWLLAIVRNTAFTWLAKNRPKAVVVTADEGLFEKAGLEMIDRAHEASPEALLIAKADAEALKRAIEALPIAYREALVLREIEGLSYQEIAAVLSVPMGTVMSRLARARALLIQSVGIAAKGAAKEKAGAA
jgi:RNA polymerase sigma-70 factor (ECF subfamily)